MRKIETFVHCRSHVAEDAYIWTGSNVREHESTGSGASIGPGVEIGKNSMIQNQANI